MIIQETVECRGCLAGLDPRSRVVFALAFAFFVVFLRDWAALAAAFASGFLLVTLGGAVNRMTVRRLAALNVFTVFLLLFVPVSAPGRPLFRLGGLAWSVDGVQLVVRIALQANTILLVCSAMLASMELSDFGHALSRLGVPGKFVHALLFCIRYLEVVHREYHRLRNAMRLRAFRARCNRHSLRSLGYMLGMLFVRSCDRSDRILEAMKCRGFHGRLYTLSESRAGTADGVFAGMAGALFIVLALLETT